jgi:hypothetical protein
MAIPIVPNLQTFSFVLQESTVIVLKADIHRTYFSIGKQVDKKDDITHVWIGLNPPIDQTAWIPLSEDTSQSLVFPHGVFGPIAIAVDGPGSGSVLILSNLAEDQNFEEVNLLLPLWTQPAGKTSTVGTGIQEYSMVTPIEYVTSPSGPLTTWAIDPPVPGFTIDQNGKITVQPQ